MIAHVRVVYLCVSGKRAEWWWFFTLPLEFSVLWRPDGSRTITQYRDEQLGLVREYLKTPASVGRPAPLP